MSATSPPSAAGPEPTPASSPADALDDVQRVRKAFEQVYDQLRDRILSGAVPDGFRLPNEAQLAASFGVSRGTIREALRLLVADNLVRTTPGARGGSFVTLPTFDGVAQIVRREVEALSHTEQVRLDDFLKARELIECDVVRQAAERRTQDDLSALRATLENADRTAPNEQYLRNREFHSVLLDVAGNPLLRLAAEPIFYVLHTHLVRSTLGPDFTRGVCAGHGQILEAIEQSDPDLAERRMRDHLAELATVYARIWRAEPEPD